MDYSKYKQSRDLSWQILISHNITELPVKISSICREMKIKFIDYEKGKDIIDKFDLLEHTEDNDGFTFRSVIFYNNKCPVPRQRFTIAHELGHILMDDGGGIYNREPSPSDIPIEQAANVFASRLLAPACVLWGLNITQSSQIADICNISMQSAQFRFERLQALYEREEHFLNKYNKSCFLQSPLERRVYNQFKGFIETHKL